MIITETPRERMTKRIAAGKKPALPIRKEVAAREARIAPAQRIIAARPRPAGERAALTGVAEKAERAWAEAKPKPFNFRVSAGDKKVDFRDFLKTSGVDWNAHVKELGGVGFSQQRLHMVAGANGGVTALGQGLSSMIAAANSTVSERTGRRFPGMGRG